MPGAQNYQPPDLMAIFSAAQSKAHQDRMYELAAQQRKDEKEQAAAKAAFQQKVLQARARYTQSRDPADLAELEAVSPDDAKGAIELAQQQSKLGATIEDNTDRWKEELASKAVERDINGNAVVNQTTWTEMMRKGMQMAQGRNIDLNEFRRLAQAGPNPQAIVEAQVGARLGMAQRTNPDFANIQKEAAGLFAAKRGDAALGDPRIAIQQDAPGYAAELQALMAAKEKENLANSKAKGVNVTANVQMPGTTDPTTAAETGISQNLMMEQDVGEMAKEIKSLARPELFGLEGAAKGGAYSALGYLSPNLLTDSARDFVKDRQGVKSYGTMMLYKFIVAMSGKAVTDAERRTIYDAIGTPDMGYDKYKSAVDAVEKIMSRQASIDSGRLNEGISTVVDQKEQAVIDRAVRALGDRLATGEIDQKQFTEGMGRVSAMWRVKYSGATKRLVSAAVERIRAAKEAGRAPDPADLETLRKTRQSQEELP